MADLFISYARKDTKLVKQIVNELQRLGFDCWMDTRSIRSGDSWTKEIVNAILDCRILLLFMSSTSMASDNVRREVHLAFENNKKIIILRLDEVEIPSTMRYQLAGIQWTDHWKQDWRTQIIAALGSAPEKTANGASGGTEPVKEPPRTERRLPFIARMALPLLACIVLLFAGYWFFVSRHMPLWTFDQNTQVWQPELQTLEKPERAAEAVDWDSRKASLQAEFNFGQVDPNALSGDTEPRATFFVNGVDGDWSDFRTLSFDVENLTAHDLKVTFTVSNADCWYEFGLFQPIASSETKTFHFDVTQPRYKTCRLFDSYNYPAPPFDKVWRFDIIVGTDERPWEDVQGSILIDNVKLTDRVAR